MPDSLTNLLPRERARLFSREYATRLGVIAAVLVTTLILFAALLLVPTYVLLDQSEDAKRTQLANEESKVSPAEEAAFSSRLTALTERATALVMLSKTPSVSATLREVLAISRPGIVISGFAYTPPLAGKSRTLTVSGIAGTRDALRTYQIALDEATTILSAVLPVSAYAQDADIAFTITITLTPS